MKLKVIGGYHAGQVVEVPNTHTVGDIWELIELPSIVPARMVRMPTGSADDAALYNHIHTYTVELWCSANGIRHLILAAPGINVLTELLSAYGKEQR